MIVCSSVAFSSLWITFHKSDSPVFRCMFIVKGSVSRFNTRYDVSSFYVNVPKPSENEAITLIGNFPLKILQPMAKTWSVNVIAIFLIRILLYFLTSVHPSIPLFMNHSHASRKLVRLFRINPLTLRCSVMTKFDIFCVHPSKCSVKFGQKLQVVAHKKSKMILSTHAPNSEAISFEKLLFRILTILNVYLIIYGVFN